MIASDQTALSIYVVMERDPVDALEMIQECGDHEALTLLLAMLVNDGTDKTDRGLNAIFVGPVKRRMSEIKETK